MIWLLAFSFSLTSCHHKPDVSKIHPNVKVERFEKDLFALNDSAAIDAFQKKYGGFFNFYCSDFMRQWNRDSTSSWRDSLLHYISDTTLHALYDSTEKVFSDFSSYENEITQALKYYRYYTGDSVNPTIITLINGPGYSTFPFGNDAVCISLDNYLGRNFSFYKFMQVPDYLLSKFEPRYLTRNTIDVLLRLRFQPDSSAQNLLDAMVMNGKVLYALQQILPDAPDSVVLGFSKKDLDWLDDNETEIWKYFITNKLLYETDPLNYEKYVNDGPNTTGMPPEAPGNVGTWIGYRIVSKYMKENKSTSVQQLLRMTDAQQILTSSKYKPL